MKSGRIMLLLAISLLFLAGTSFALPQELEQLWKHEPSIREVQEAAVRYAEVDNAKIQAWRRAAKNKALLPRLSVGVDSNVSRTYEIYTSSTKSYDVLGPDDKTTGWDVSLSWDLGELIWNDDQTQIDVRSKLMVQLRDDILDEVTRLYFERRRLMLQIYTKPAQDEIKKVEQQLRLAELTASIDALTGGFFSRQIALNKASAQKQI